MHPLQKRFHDFIDSHQLLKKDEKALVGVSGGVDSMVLANLLRDGGFSFSIAHCNYGLRGDDSDEDEQFVVQWAKKHGIECYVRKIKLTKGSIQLKAREERYEWFKELLEKDGADKIVTAHHLDDSIETSLINMVRGTGLKGLKGIALRNDSIIRPLLFANKEDIVSYAKNLGLQWREDASNETTVYDRNKIRHEVIPVLRELNTSLIATYSDTRERLDLTYTRLQKEVLAIKNEFFDERKGELQLEWMVNPEDLVILNEILSNYGYNYKTVKEIFSSKGQAGKTFPIQDYCVYMDRSSLIIKKTEEAGDTSLQILGSGTYQLNEVHLRVEEVGIDHVIKDDHKIACFDFDRVKFPLTLRYWKEGDQFQPLGMQGNKKISDFLIDQKIPLARKNKVMVLEDEERILWLVGFRISEVVKVMPTTGAILNIELI